MISAGEKDFDEETQGGADRARVTERHPREWYGNLMGSLKGNLLLERFCQIHSVINMSRSYFYVLCAELSLK